MNRFERIARGLLSNPINPYGTSILGVMTFMWGLWIVNPFWEAFSRAPVFGRTLEFAPEWAWGTWSTTCGGLIIYALLRNHVRILVYSLGFAIWHWMTIAGMFWWGDWQNTAGITYTFIGFYSVFAYLNVKLNFLRTGKSLG